MKLRNRLASSAFLASFLGCALLAPTAATATSSAAEDSLVAQLGDVPNACRPYPWLVTGGHPTRNALEALAKAGFHDVFDLRAAGDPRDFDEPEVARALNLNYLSIPTTPANFSDSKFTAFRHHLLAHGPDNPMFLHCASGNRVGAAILPWLVLDMGMSEDVALETARTVGLKSPELTKRALEYIRTHERAMRSQ